EAVVSRRRQGDSGLEWREAMAGLGESGEAPVIRVVRKKKRGGGHHGGAWKVAYADFVTAMMAFFLVMWIVGLSKPTRQAIAAYFKNPSLFEKAGGRRPIGEADATKLAKPVPVSSSDTAKLQAQFKAKA